jgi:hypothetical protein
VNLGIFRDVGRNVWKYQQGKDEARHKIRGTVNNVRATYAYPY